LNFQTEGYFNF